MRGIKGPNFLAMRHVVLLGLLVIYLLTGCSTPRNVAYFQDVNSAQGNLQGDRQQYTQPRLKPNDIITVSIQTLTPQAPAGGTSGSAQSEAATSPATGYMIAADGTTDLPLVGKVQLAGLTTTEAKEQIRTKAQQYYKDPIVSVKYANFTVMVMGEVNKPGPVTVANEKLNIVDAIGMAGDMSIYGKRENVLLVREEDGKNVYVHFDLNSSKTFQSPYFYLKSGDIVYIEPNNLRKKGATVDTSRERYIGYAVSAISLLLSIYAIFGTRN